MKSRTLPVLAILCAVLVAADWPQWRGPDRTGVSKETGLLSSFPSNGPALLWTHSDAGLGYSGPAIVGDRLYCMGAFGKEERVYALDVSTGKQLWATTMGVLYPNKWGEGPRGTPTVDGDVLFAISGKGDLVCVETAEGKKRWSKSLVKDFYGIVPKWGYAESPLVDGDKLICSPGGSKGTLAALDKKTGNGRGRSTELREGAAYSSAILADCGGVRQYVQMTRDGVVGVAADNLKLLWKSELGANETAVIPTPICRDNFVYVTSGYRSGCGLLKLTQDGKGGTGASQLYANKEMVNHHGGVVLVDEHLYGFSDGKGWICQNFKSGDIVWTAKGIGKGSLTCADGKLFCYSEVDGTLAMIEASPKGWRELGRFKIPQQTTRRSPQGKIWTHPVVANGRLYLRDQDLLFCFNVKQD